MLIALLFAFASAACQWQNHTILYRNKAKEIAVAHEEDSVYVLGFKVLQGGYQLRRYSERMSWMDQQVAFGAIKLAVSPNGTVILMTQTGLLKQKEGEEWKDMTGCAQDIAFGGDGSLFKLGCNRNRNGNLVYKWVDGAWKWFKFGGGVMLAVDGEGAPWVVNNKKTLFKWSGVEKRWRYMGLEGVGGVAGGPTAVYALAGREEGSESYQIYRWVEKRQWQLIKGQKAFSIAVGKADKPYVVTKIGRIYWPNCTDETFMGSEMLLTAAPLNNSQECEMNDCRPQPVYGQWVVTIVIGCIFVVFIVSLLVIWLVRRGGEPEVSAHQVASKKVPVQSEMPTLCEDTAIQPSEKIEECGVTKEDTLE